MAADRHLRSRPARNRKVATIGSPRPSRSKVPIPKAVMESKAWSASPLLSRYATKNNGEIDIPTPLKVLEAIRKTVMEIEEEGEGAPVVPALARRLLRTVQTKTLVVNRKTFAKYEAAQIQTEAKAKQGLASVSVWNHTTQGGMDISPTAMHSRDASTSQVLVDTSTAMAIDADLAPASTDADADALAQRKPTQITMWTAAEFVAKTAGTSFQDPAWAQPAPHLTTSQAGTRPVKPAVYPPTPNVTPPKVAMPASACRLPALSGTAGPFTSDNSAPEPDLLEELKHVVLALDDSYRKVLSRVHSLDRTVRTLNARMMISEARQLNGYLESLGLELRYVPNLQWTREADAYPPLASRQAIRRLSHKNLARWIQFYYPGDVDLVEAPIPSMQYLLEVAVGVEKSMAPP